MAARASTKEQYPFTRLFEVSIARHFVLTPRFYETIGHAIDPERVPSPDLQRLVKAARAVAKLAGPAALNRAMVLQHLRQQQDEGKVSIDQRLEVEKLLDLGEDIDDSETDVVIAMTLASVRRFVEEEALEAALKDAATGLDERVVERFDNVVNLGKYRAAARVAKEDPTEQDMAAMVAPVQASERLPTGVADLDVILKGGMERKALGMVQAGTGGGKSLFLSHLLANAVLSGVPALYVTLELSEQEVRKRVFCNLCGMTAEEIHRSPAEAARRYQLLKGRGIAPWGVVYQTSRATTMQHVRRLVRDTEKEWGIEIPLLVVDEAGKVVWRMANSERRSYDEQRDVYQDLRNIAVEKNGWTWTASQVKAGYDGKKHYGVDAGADSAEKARLVDVLVEIPRTMDDRNQGVARFRVPKRRIDEAHGEAGPLPMDAAHGRVAVVSDREELWA